MTYKELVDSIKGTVDRHLILKDFGYGALTDIKTVDEGTRVDYPYAFLNPTQSTRTGQTITYRFNLIVMDVVQEDPTSGFANYLKVQSECQQYVDDILANLRFAKPYEQFDLTLNVNLTPFKERFQDTVAGMTATLEMELPLALNDCITPIPEKYILDYAFINNLILEPDPTGRTIATQTPTYDPQGLYINCYYSGVKLNQSLKQYQVVLKGTAKALEAKPITSAPYIGLAGVNMVSCTFSNNPPFTRALPDTTTWPEGQTTTTEFEWEAIYEIVVPALDPDINVNIGWEFLSNSPGDEALMEFINTDIKIYEL
jgi:hypothetical protein